MENVNIEYNSITSATGWAAVYELNGNTTALPLVSWALGRWLTNSEEMERGVFGLVVDNGSVVPAKSLENFKTYDFDFDTTATDYLDLND